MTAHLVNLWAWLKKPTSWAVLLLAVGVTIALYASLTGLAKQTAVAKRAAERQSEKDRSDNATLCEFFRGTDLGLRRIFSVAPATTVGSVIRDSLVSIQQNAGRVVLSPICPPPKKPGG